MFIKIDFKSKIPIYLQLRNQIVQGIASGKLKENESLPSVRQLAKDLSINMHTINKSYKILQNENFVSIHKRKGVQVNSYTEIKDLSYEKELANKLKPILAEANCKGVLEKKVNDIVKQIYKYFSKEESNGNN